MIGRSIFALLLLAACSSSPRELPHPTLPERTGVDPIVAARAEGVQFMGHGDAPLFHVRIYEDRITFALDGGAPETFPKPQPLYPRWNGEIYETRNERHALTLSIRRDRRCPTDASLNIVLATLDERELAGCGRDL